MKRRVRERETMVETIGVRRIKTRSPQKKRKKEEKRKKPATIKQVLRRARAAGS